MCHSSNYSSEKKKTISSRIVGDMKYDGFTGNDIFREKDSDKDSLHDQVQQARNALMLEKGLNPGSMQDIEKIKVEDYVGFIKTLATSSHEKKAEFIALFRKLSVTGYDVCGFFVGGAPWDPNTTAPTNDIMCAYIASTMEHRTTYKKMAEFDLLTECLESSKTADDDGVLDVIGIEERQSQFRIDGGMLANFVMCDDLKETKK